MSTVFEVPLRPSQNQSFSVQLNSVVYKMTVKWNVPASCWMLDIHDVNDVAIVNGIPLVTGANLLEQYAYLGIGGEGAELQVQTDNDQFAVPTYANLGVSGRLYFIQP